MKNQRSFANNFSTLYLLATPIGNLDEFSSRALKILKSSSFYIVESRLKALKIINNFDLKDKSTFVLNTKNEHLNYQFLLNKIKSHNAVLMSDAGYPCVSDPGFLLINEVKKLNDINLVVINGPNAALHLLSISGFSLRPYVFYGFLSRTQGKRLSELTQLVSFQVPFVLYESNQRMSRLIDELKKVCQNCCICVGKELTKKNEQIFWGSLSEFQVAIEKWSLKGEFTVIINPLSIKN